MEVELYALFLIATSLEVPCDELCLSIGIRDLCVYSMDDRDQVINLLGLPASWTGVQRSVQTASCSVVQ
jgi:hypothetical protein